MTSVAGPAAAVMADLDVRLGGPGWLERLGFDVVDSPVVPAGQALLLVDRSQLVVGDLAGFREMLDWHQLDVDVRRIFNRALSELAAGAGVPYQPIRHWRAAR